MKKMIMLALALMVATIAFTQRPKHQPNPELQKEMQSYIEKNVVPVLQKAQDELDAQLSAEDLKFIEAKRIETAEIRAEKRAEHQRKMEERKARKEEFENMTEAEKEAFRKEKREKRKAMREEMKAEHAESKEAVKAFMQRNEELIKSTMTSLKPNYEKWIADQKAIIQKYHPDAESKMKERKGKGKIGLFGLEPHRGRHHKRGKRGKRDEAKMEGEMEGEKAERMEKRKHKKGSKLAAAFVLWDGTIPTPPAASTRNENKNGDAFNGNANALLGQNFPNPAKDMTSIQLEVPAGVTQMILTVTDMNGKVAQRLNLANLNQGKENINLDVSDLSNGQYFYTIEYNGLKESKKMTVSH